MKKTEIKNEKFHKQLGGEKIKEAAIILLLNYSNTIIYDIVCSKNYEQLQKRIKELDNNNIIGLSYVAVTENYSFVEYERKIVTSK